MGDAGVGVGVGEPADAMGCAVEFIFTAVVRDWSTERWELARLPPLVSTAGSQNTLKFISTMSRSFIALEKTLPPVHL